MQEGWHLAMASAALAEGLPQRVLIGSADILLIRSSGVHAVGNQCTHADACLHEGRVRGHRIICPLHGASFDVRTGAVLGKPATQPLPRYEVREADGGIWGRLEEPV